jgi:hypothetical protein
MLNTESIQVTQELLALLSEIDEFKGAWRALGTRSFQSNFQELDPKSFVFFSGTAKLFSPAGLPWIRR